LDLLTDILDQAGVRRRMLYCHRLPASGALRFPCDRSMGFHVLTRGEAFLHPLEGDSGRITLHAGDVALMSRGCQHVISRDPHYRAEDARLTGWNQAPAVLDDTPEHEPALLVSGAYQLWHNPVHPFFQELPDWSVVPASATVDTQQLNGAIQMLDTEVSRNDLGAQSVVHALLDVLFMHVLRRIVVAHGGSMGSWSHGIQEPRIRQVIELMHTDFARDWTLSDLAHEVGLSRASLAEKFRAAAGSTPGDYLRKVRVQRAMRLLSESNDGLDAIAVAVGYGDAFSFSKVFKKIVGVSPSRYRMQDRAEQTSPFRV